jgi:hypothetical protein
MNAKALLAAVSRGTRDAAAFGLDARVHLIDSFFFVVISLLLNPHREATTAMTTDYLYLDFLRY